MDSSGSTVPGTKFASRVTLSSSPLFVVKVIRAKPVPVAFTVELSASFNGTSHRVMLTKRVGSPSNEWDAQLSMTKIRSVLTVF